MTSSVGNGAVIFISTEPDAPVNLARDNVETTTTQIGFTWEEAADNGGQIVLDYRISFDQSTDTWITLATAITNTYYTKGDLITGNTYKFKVEARNAVGYSV